MSNTTEQFIRAYEDIFAEVNRRAGASSSHHFQIERAAECDSTVKRNRRLLMYIRDIRHALQHPQHRSGGHAFCISEAFLKEMQELLNRLQKRKVANSFGISVKDVKTARCTDRLGDLADEMRHGQFTHVPILDERGVVIGVFNEAAVFDHLWSESEVIVGREMQVSDILRHCRLDANHTETFRFVGPRTPIDDIVEIFRHVESLNTRVGAIFVTISGKETDRLQRLITPWDILESLAE